MRRLPLLLALAACDGVSVADKVATDDVDDTDAASVIDTDARDDTDVVAVDTDPADTDTVPADTDTVPADPQVIRFVALGDAGEGNDEQHQVADAIGAVCALKGCEFALYLG